VGRAGLGRAEEKKEKKIGWARWAGKRVGCLFVFFSFFFQFLFSHFFFKLLLKIFSNFFKPTFDHTINQNPCIQHDAQTLGFSNLFNYHCIYFKANLIIQIH
jgi:hypothetical protein